VLVQYLQSPVQPRNLSAQIIIFTLRLAQPRLNGLQHVGLWRGSPAKRVTRRRGVMPGHQDFLPRKPKAPDQAMRRGCSRCPLTRMFRTQHAKDTCQFHRIARLHPYLPFWSVSQSTAEPLTYCRGCVAQSTVYRRDRCSSCTTEGFPMAGSGFVHRLPGHRFAGRCRHRPECGASGKISKHWAKPPARRSYRARHRNPMVVPLRTYRSIRYRDHFSARLRSSGSRVPRLRFLKERSCPNGYEFRMTSGCVGEGCRDRP
jgi:hypothetical protein